MTWPNGDPDAVVKSILRDRAYHAAPVTNAHERLSVWAAIFERIWEWLKPLRVWFDRLLHGAGTGGALLAYAIALAVGVLLVWLAYRIVRSFFVREKRRAGALSGGGALAERDPAAWRAIASQAAAAGDFARAISALFAAALAVLDERNIVPFDPARTPGEYRRAVARARATLAKDFDRLAAAFVRATFAPAPVGPADYDDAARAFAAFEPAVFVA
ncbi:MAG: DUF4129 domain-containing protein [Candidatus Eremiobacteraeota bacterium]|nr:DUF4129 domain-containing protein [Candidatus Eremiobacteraeota bacterium]